MPMPALDSGAGRPGGSAGEGQLGLREGLARGPRDSDFAMVRPHLAEVVRLTREPPRRCRPALGLTPYDALMDGYQRGHRAPPTWRRCLPPMRRSWPRRCPRPRRGRPAPASPLRPEGPFPVAAQEALCRRRSGRLGLDFAHARLDRSAHPFSGGTPTDVRITTRYVEADFTQAVLAVVHETGHALYERGLPDG